MASDILHDILSSEFVQGVDTLSPSVRCEILQQLFTMEKWELLSKYLRYIFWFPEGTSDEEKKKCKIRIAPPRPMDVADWAKKPTLPMLYAIVEYLETSHQHLRVLVESFVNSKDVIALMTHSDHFELLCRLLELWGTLLCSSAQRATVPVFHRLPTLDVFIDLGGIDIAWIGQSKYVSVLRFFSKEVWEASMAMKETAAPAHHEPTTTIVEEVYEEYYQQEEVADVSHYETPLADIEEEQEQEAQDEQSDDSLWSFSVPTVPPVTPIAPPPPPAMSVLTISTPVVDISVLPENRMFSPVNLSGGSCDASIIKPKVVTPPRLVTLQPPPLAVSAEVAKKKRKPKSAFTASTLKAFMPLFSPSPVNLCPPKRVKLNTFLKTAGV